MAQVLTSISGLPISAASAGFAPTNSADVSAIASGYQVVSSTSTELYAGTAFLTGVNDAPVSASRAGNAANAGMANSAYYDGTGRLISSLPDSAAVSSIASSYAESAASGKADSSAFGSIDFYGTGYFTGLSGSGFSADWATRAISDANGRYLTNLAAESSLSSKQDTLTFAYDADSAISSINGSALAGGGGGATGDYVEKSAMEVAIGSGNNVSGTAFAQGADNLAKNSAVAFGRLNTAGYDSMSVGQSNSASSWSVSLGNGNRSKNTALGQGYANHAESASLAQGEYNYANSFSLAQGRYNSAVSASFAQGKGNSAYFTAAAFGTYNLRGNGHTSAHSAAFVIGDGTASTARHDLMLVTKDGEITMYSSTADTTGTGIMSSIRAISAAATGGGVDSATVSAIASSYVESGVSSKLDTSAQVVTSIQSSDYQYGGVWITGVKGVNGDFLAAHWRDDGEELAAYADISGVIDTVSSNSATWGQGGIDSATCSSIASSYAESAASSKLDTTAFNSGDFYSTSNPSGFITGVDLSDYATTAYVDSSVSGKLDTTAFNSGDFYTTANESGYVGSAYVDSAVSGKMDSSALSSYVPYSSLEYNTASAISGINGSALAAGSTYSAGEGIDITDDVISVEAPVDIVAGPGIVIDNPDGNTLRVSMAQDYEVTLWSGSCLRQGSAAVSLSESASNFEKIEIYAVPNPSDGFVNNSQIFAYPGSSTAGAYLCPFMTTGLKGKFSCGLWTITNGTSFNLIAAGQTDSYPSQNWDNTYGGVVKIVGIHRTASN